MLLAAYPRRRGNADHNWWTPSIRAGSGDHTVLYMIDQGTSTAIINVSHNNRDANNTL
jgi:hypothetical protein